MHRTLHIASPIEHGPDVLALQVELRKLGISPGTPDSRYGPKTVAAVKQFQHAHRLASDGIVGKSTWAKLDALEKPKVSPLAVHPHTVAAIKKAAPHKLVFHAGTPGEKALVEMAKDLGLKEGPPANSNHTKFGVWIGVDKCAWCNISVSHAFFVGAGVTLCKGFHGPGVVARGCTYVPTTEAWFRAMHEWHGRVQPQSGWVPCYNWDGGVPDHIGIAATHEDLALICPDQFDAALHKYGPAHAGEFWAIEGNTGDGNDSNGGEQMIRLRSISTVDGFGVVKG